MRNRGDKTRPCISVGFPNPALESVNIPLDLNELVVKNPISTYYFKVEGEDWVQLGVNRGDILVIDRSLEPKAQQLVLFTREGEFGLDKFDRAQSGDELWGVITYQLQKKA